MIRKLPETDDTDRTAIHALFDRIKAAWATGDAKQLANAFSEDAVFVAFNGTRLIGRAAIMEFHEQPFATIFRGGTLDIDIDDIQPLAPDIYLAATNGGPLIKGGHQRAEETQSYVICHRGDEWAIALFQNTPISSVGGSARP